MKKVGRLVFKVTKSTKQDWNMGFSFIVYKDKGEYFVRVREKLKELKKLHDWGNKIRLIDMIILINHSKKRNGSGEITINTLPKEVMDRANRELILDRLK